MLKPIKGKGKRKEYIRGTFIPNTMPAPKKGKGRKAASKKAAK